MTESNTPPENPKKKSAFSRFFSRKESNTQSVAETNTTSVDEKPASSLSTSGVSLDQAKAISSAISSEKTEQNFDHETKATEQTQPEPKIEAVNQTPSSSIQTDLIPQHTEQSTPVIEVETATPHKAIEKEASAEEPIANQVTSNASETQSAVEKGLDKSRSNFFKKISDVFKGSFDLNDELFDELEELLITSDIGIEASINLVEKLRSRVKNEKIQDAKGVVAGLRTEVTQMLKQSEREWKFQQKPYVIMMVGVNGAGKTTTTAKIAKQFQQQGKSVMLAAADTFRAAAVEQLQEWGKRLDIPVIAQEHGSDAAAVAHDALTSAIARNIDILMIDTAGRLHTQSDLMEQLKKVNRVLAKIDPSTPHEVMQILDAGTGQNALAQLEHFQKAVGVSSICLTKLDGSAKGGVTISLSEKYKLPIRFIGVGEGFNDIKPFSASQFANALIPELDK